MKNKELKELYERALNNCRFYLKENMNKNLLNEIGVLRGISYVLELNNINVVNDEFINFIKKQNELLYVELKK